MDDRLRALLEQYIDEEQRGLAPDPERLSGGDPQLLAALRNSVREYHEAQGILGGPVARETSETLTAPVRNESRDSRRPPQSRFRLSRGGRGGSLFLCLLVLSLACAYVLLRLLWAESHFRPAVAIATDLTLDRALTSRGDTYGLDPGFRITQVSGEPVQSLGALHDAIDRGGRRQAMLKMERREDEGRAFSSREVLWVERPRFSPPAVDSDLRLLAGDPLVSQGVAAGTRVVEVDGQAVRSVEELRSIARARLGRAMQIAFEKPADGSGVDLAVVTVVEWAVHRTLYLVGAVFGALGLVALWLKPRSRSSRSFVFFCLLVAAFWLLRAIPHHYRSVMERQVYLLCMCLFPLATVALIGTFTPLRWSWVPLSRYLVGAGVLSALFYFGSFLISPGQAAVGLLADAFLLPWLGVSLGLVLVGQVSDSWARLRKRRLEADDVQRARALRWASLFAFVPYLLTSYLAIGSGRELRIWIELSVLAFPLVIAYSIHRRNLLQINELLHETVVLTFIVVLLRLGYGVLFGLTVPIAERYPQSSTPLRAVLLGGGMVAAGSLHRVARSAVLRRFRPPPPNWPDIARRLDDHGAGSSTPVELASSLVKAVADELGPVDTSLLLKGPGPGNWWLAAQSRYDLSGPTLEHCRPLLDFLAEREEATPIFRDDLIDDLRYRPLRDDLLRGMDALSATVMFPVPMEDRVSGALAVGDRPDRRNYSREELRLVEQMCRRVGHDLHAAFVTSQQPRAGIAAQYPRFPAKIGEFSIEGVLGEGGMACVFLGRSDGRPAAIKVPNLHVQSVPALLERFLRERSVLRTLSHRNIVPVLKTGWAMGEPYLAMEYFPRGTLHDYLVSRSRLDENEALGLAGQIAHGLAAALKHGVIHRDLKLKNVFLTEDDVLKVGDFGLAHLDEASTLTSEGGAFGTPAYVSPEVLQGEGADWRSDQYALGICLFEMLIGRRPFQGSTFAAVSFQHLHQPAPSPRGLRPELQEATAAIVLRMLAKSPGERYSSYEELLMATGALEREATA